MSELRRNFLGRIATGAAVAGSFAALTSAEASALRGGVQEAHSVFDFMTPAMRQDALSRTPSMDHTGALQAAFDSGVLAIEIPGSSVFQISRPLVINRKIRVFGGGELRFVAGIANAPAITVHADGCEFDGVFLTNPHFLQAAVGERNAGIVFRANLGTVTRSTLQFFQNGIQVEASGEYHDFIISSNKILDCIGAGGGPNDTRSSSGEDRGDGITIWGCCATITGNLVTAKVGQDCRIGIHAEALAQYHGYSFPLQGNLCTISGNVVRGSFRRSIVTENVDNTTITGNTCEGATWWGIAVARSQLCSVIGNTVIIDRARTDASGSVWSPIHAGVMIYGGAVQCIVSGNTVDVMHGFAEAAIALQGLNADDTDSGARQAASTNGTTSVTLSMANPGIKFGQLIKGPGVPPSTFVTNVNGTALSASNPISKGSPTLMFTWHDRGQGLTVTNNSVLCNPANEVIGVWAQYQDQVTISGNNLRYVGKFGISCYDTTDPLINGNTVCGRNGNGNGIDLRSNNTGAVVVGNMVEGFDAGTACGIALANRAGGTISGNFVRGCGTDIDLYGCTEMSVTGNSSVGCVHHYTSGNGRGMILANNSSS